MLLHRPVEPARLSGHLILAGKQSFAYAVHRYAYSKGSQERVARLPAHLAHPLQDDFAVVNHVIGPSLQGQRQNGGELGRVLPVDIPGRGSVVVFTRRLRPINTPSPLDHIEVKLQNTPLAEDQLGHRNKRDFGSLAQDRAARSEEKILHKLLRNGGPAAKAAAFHVVFRSDLYCVPVESMMLIKARVFRSDHGMLEIGRDTAQRNEFVTFAIRRPVNPGLHATLHVHRGGRWVEPSGSHQHQRRERPKKRRSDEKPPNEGPEQVLSKNYLWRRAWVFRHASE